MDIFSGQKHGRLGGLCSKLAVLRGSQQIERQVLQVSQQVLYIQLFEMNRTASSTRRISSSNFLRTFLFLPQKKHGLHLKTVEAPRCV